MMQHDRGDRPAGKPEDRPARGFRLSDLFGAFWQPGAKALHILGSSDPGAEDQTPGAAGPPPGPAAAGETPEERG
jgi:hypothetical protein